MEQPNIKTVTEDDVIEYVIQQLYQNLDKNEMHLEKDLLIPAGLELDDKQSEHLRELLLATQLIKPSIGFGKNGFIYLTGQGIQIIKTYGSYRNFIRQTHRLEHTQVMGEMRFPEQRVGNNPNNDIALGYDDMAH